MINHLVEGPHECHFPGTSELTNKPLVLDVRRFFFIKAVIVVGYKRRRLTTHCRLVGGQSARRVTSASASALVCFTHTITACLHNLGRTLLQSTSACAWRLQSAESMLGDWCDGVAHFPSRVMLRPSTKKSRCIDAALCKVHLRYTMQSRQ